VKILGPLDPGRNPPYLIWLTTARCNASCRHCFYRERMAAAPRDELLTEELLTFFSRYGPLQYLTLGGGEPSLRDDLPEVIAAAAGECRLKHLNFITNGFLPSTIAGQVGDILAGTSSLAVTVTLSLDGMERDHDGHRGVEGGFRRSLETLALLKGIMADSPRLLVTVTTVYSADTASGVEELHDFVFRELRLPHKIILHRDRGNWKIPGPGVEVERFLAVARRFEEDYDRIRPRSFGPFGAMKRALDHLRLDVLEEISSGGCPGWKCAAGRSGIVLTESGELWPCEPLRRSFGNIRTAGYRVAPLLRSREARELMKTIGGGECRCVWECQLRASLLYQPRFYPALLRGSLRRLRRSRRAGEISSTGPAPGR